MHKRSLNLLFAIGLILPGVLSWHTARIAAAPYLAPYELQVLESSADGVELELVTNQYLVRDETIDGLYHQSITVSGMDQNAQPGAPALPQTSVLIGVPAGAKLKIDLLDDQIKPLEGVYRLAPAASPAALSTDLTPGKLESKTDALIYASSQAYPESPVRIASDAWLRNRRVVRIEFSPFQYTPATGRVVQHRSLRVAIRFEHDSNAPLPVEIGSPVSPGDPFEAVARSSLVNYAAAAAWRYAAAPEAPKKPAVATAGEPGYRIEITRDGIYRLTYAALQAAGLPVADIDPTTFAMTSQGAAVAIHVANLDGNEHVFSASEYVLFYGQKFYGDRMAARYTAEDDLWLMFSSMNALGAYTTWTPHMTAGMLEKYTDANVYWLYHGGAAGARMPVLNSLPASGNIPATHRETRHAEQSHVWKTTHFTSEDTWFWQEITTTSSVTKIYTTTLSAVATGAYTATLRGELVAITNNDSAGPDHHIQVYLNDPAHSLPPVVDETWEGKSRFVFSAQVPQSRLVDGTNQLDIVVYKTAVMVFEDVFFNWFEVEYDRNFQADANQITFTGVQTGTLEYQVGGFTSADLGLLDITTPFTPTRISGYGLAGGVMDFTRSQGMEARYAAGQVTDITSAAIQYYAPPDFSQPAEYLVITHHDLAGAAQALADYRITKGLTARVIDIQDLYNVFNDGIYHPLAIKNFLAYTFANWATPPTYVVLAGDGHWNLKGYTGYDAPPVYIPPYLTWADPWQGEVDSANLLATVVGADPLPDVLISRMTVNNAQEFANMFNKVTAYEAAPIEDWQRHVMYVADDVPDNAGPFITLTEDIIASYITPGWTADRVYLNDFLPCTSPCLDAIGAITQTLNSTGALMVNYVGHGGINFWAAPQVLRNSDAATLNNANRLPVLLSLTCLDGYWLHPNLSVGSKSGPGMVEEYVRSGGRGAVAAFSPTGLGVSTGHDALQRGFYDSMFVNGDWRLGAATLAAKVRLYNTGGNFDLLHTFTTFGDPALQIASPYRLDMGPGNLSDSGAPGSVVTYTLQVTNTGVLADSFVVDAAASAWAVNVPAPIGPLQPGIGASFDVGVVIPAGAQDNDVYAFPLIVHSEGDIGETDTITLTTTAHPYGVSLGSPVSQKSAPPGQVVTYTVDLANTGGFTDSFDIQLSGNTWPTQLSTSTLGPLAPGGHASLVVSVSIPVGAQTRDVDSVAIRAISQGDSSKLDEINLTTTAGPAYALSVTPATSSKSGDRGGAVGYSLTIHNDGLNTDTYQVSINGNAWTTVSIPQNGVVGPVAGGQTGGVSFTVLIPINAANGASDIAVITVTSQGSPGINQTAELHTGLTGYNLFLPKLNR